MSKWEQNAVFEYSEYICLVKRINGIVAQKTLVSELVRCKECKCARNIEGEWICEHLSGMARLNVLVKADDFCSYGVRLE